MKPAIILMNAMLFASLACPAAGQVQSYHHRSTAYGDATAAEAELHIGLGIRSCSEALAYEAMMRAERQRLDNRYQFVEGVYRRKELKRQAIAAKRQANLARIEREAAAIAAEAAETVRAIKAGAAAWPAGLERPECAGAVSRVERILKDWPDGPASSDNAQRRALGAIAAQLRDVIAHGSQDVPFAERIRAMKTVKQLENLAGEPAGDRALLARR